VHVQLSGVALDSGHFGDSVRVRLGDTRKSRTVLRGVVTGVGTVNVAEEGG
jgi:flagella basal body P-ring formation protein FlgA